MSRHGYPTFIAAIKNHKIRIVVTYLAVGSILTVVSWIVVILAFAIFGVNGAGLVP